MEYEYIYKYMCVCTNIHIAFNGKYRTGERETRISGRDEFSTILFYFFFFLKDDRRIHERKKERKKERPVAQLPRRKPVSRRSSLGCDPTHSDRVKGVRLRWNDEIANV